MEDDSQDLENEQAAGTETGTETITEGEAGQPDNQTDNQTILRLLEEGEMVSLVLGSDVVKLLVLGWSGKALDLDLCVRGVKPTEPFETDIQMMLRIGMLVAFVCATVLCNCNATNNYYYYVMLS